MKTIGTTGELVQELKAEGRNHWLTYVVVAFKTGPEYVGDDGDALRHLNDAVREGGTPIGLLVADKESGLIVIQGRVVRGRPDAANDGRVPARVRVRHAVEPRAERGQRDENGRRRGQRGREGREQTVRRRLLPSRTLEAGSMLMHAERETLAALPGRAMQTCPCRSCGRPAGFLVELLETWQRRRSRTHRATPLHFSRAKVCRSTRVGISRWQSME
jgi:hypothetical protein